MDRCVPCWKCRKSKSRKKGHKSPKEGNSENKQESKKPTESKPKAEKYVYCTIYKKVRWACFLWSWMNTVITTNVKIFSFPIWCPKISENSSTGKKSWEFCSFFYRYLQLSRISRRSGISRRCGMLRWWLQQQNALRYKDQFRQIFDILEHWY